jgi:hypothetical protein
VSRGLEKKPEADRVARPLRVVGDPFLHDFALAVDLTDRAVRMKDELSAFYEIDLSPLEPMARRDGPSPLWFGRHYAPLVGG